MPEKEWNKALESAFQRTNELRASSGNTHLNSELEV